MSQSFLHLLYVRRTNCHEIFTSFPWGEFKTMEFMSFKRGYNRLQGIAGELLQPHQLRHHVESLQEVAGLV